MKALLGVLRSLLGLGIVLALIGCALVFAPPVLIRHALLYYLDTQGVDATIGHVDADLLTGDVTIDQARGRRDGHTVFDIGHLSASLSYPGLLDHRLELTHIELADTTIDIRRRGDNTFRIGGIEVPPSQTEDDTTTDWRFGLSRLRLKQLTLNYSQPATETRAAIDRRMTLNHATASDIKTWQPDDAVPMAADIGYDESHIQLSGRITPFRPKPSAHLRLRTADLALDRLSPITGSLGLTRLRGSLDSDQQIDMVYDPAHDLSVQISGSMTWQKARLAAHNGLALQSRRLQWQGKLKADLLKSGNQASSMEARGRLQLANLSARQPGQFDFQQDSGGWQGQAHATLAPQATTIDTHGQLTTQNTHLSAANRLKLSARRSTLNGDLSTRLTADNTRIQTDGSFDARGMSFSIPDNMRFDSDALNWRGKTTTQLGDSATRINTDGHMNIDALGLRVADTSTFQSDAVIWKGATDIRSAALFSRQANGHLTLDHPFLTIDGSPTAISADRLAYDGRYAEQPNADNNALRLTLHGDIDSHRFKVDDTAIDAPWLSMQQARATDLSVDGFDRIQLSQLDTHGVRMLGDTDTASAVVQAVSLKAHSLALDDLSHYSVDDIRIDDAIIHTRRTPRGWGVISEFLGDDNDSGKSDGVSGSSKPHNRPTYAVRHFSLSGPAATFVDTAVNPRVKIRGSRVSLTVDGLDTRQADEQARYRLSLDLGAYGHLDSLGQIAPLASEGINLDLNAWLRSLAMAPVSGYLNAAMGRQIANGAADGTLHLTATDGELDGVLDTQLSNFRLVDNGHEKTDIAFGISLDSALSLVRDRSDLIDFKTSILGDVTNPYFSIENLVREAVLAGLRTTLLSDYSPVGLLNRARNTLLNLFRSVSDRPAKFKPGYHYIQPGDRKYLGLIAQYLYTHPATSLTVQGHANPGDRKALTASQGAQVSLAALAGQRGEAVRDYLAARNVNPDRVALLEPIVDADSEARPRATFTLDKP